MGLSIGIIGLPNVGKSSLFNALAKEQLAQVANYPFCTIHPNHAIVPVPDDRVEQLADLVKVEKRIHATIEFVDIAGLVKGASHGEGLGNQFLGNIRDTAAILHIVRCFEDPHVIHTSDHLDPRGEIETINIELILADMQQLDKKVERLSSQVKGDKKSIPLIEMAKTLYRHLGEGKPISQFPDKDEDSFIELVNEMRFLSAKPVIYVANVDESSLQEGSVYSTEVYSLAAEQDAPAMTICARLEQELVDMSETERKEYLQLAGAEETGLEQVIRQSFSILSLITFLTMNEEEVRAWMVPQGTPAPKAAGTIHTDFERGFIRAEVTPFETFIKHKSWSGVKSAGLMRLEGKEYIVHDGDVIYFRFNI
ncbi:MAG: redox-regulated ATPase YchF [Anaerolineales bacterium]|nr:redox-regulated ATPase YchF [Anaerolineales bacterium]